MALAQRLNELATANATGLLNDDEYRILRQNVFEQHANTIDLSPTPAVSPVKPTRASPRKTLQKSVVELHIEPPPTKPSRPLGSGMTNLIRRATGRKAPGPVNDSFTTSPTKSPKRSIIPRILHRRPSDLITPHRPDSSRVPKESLTISLKLANARSQSSLSYPASPTSPRHLAAPPSPRFAPPSTTDELADINDDLHTSKDIRRAITEIEAEVTRLVEAFDNLEQSTSIRVRRRNAEITSPRASVVNGRPKHERAMSASNIFVDTRPSQRLALMVDTSNDGLSIRSNSSAGTSQSQSKSVSSSRRQPSAPPSPLSRFQWSSSSLRRQNSASSASSRKLSVKGDKGLSRSLGHLPLHKVTESEGSPLEPESEEDVDPEVLDIRRRKYEVVARYKERVEYLRAKLKGAELHEKLLRR